MKKSTISKIACKPRLLSLCLLAIALLSINAYAAVVDLGTAASFGVLAGSAITSTGNTSIDGDIGIWPDTASSVTGFPPGFYTGVIHAGDAVAQQAQLDALAAYNGLAGMAYTMDLSGQDLGGMTLTPGVYSFSSSAQLTGGLTLDAQNNPNAMFVFQIGSTLTTTTEAAVLMINAPDGFSNQYWQVGSSATLGVDTEFEGTILAFSSITLNGGSLDGRAIALNGAVNIAAQETIIVPEIIPEPATIALLIFGAGFVSRKVRKNSK